MVLIRYTNDNGEIVEEELVNRTVTFVYGTNDEEFQPAVVERAEFDDKSQSSSITTVCGETENRKESDEKPRFVIEGIVTDPQIDTLRTLKAQRQLTLITNIDQLQVYVKRLTIEQNTDIIEAEMSNGETELAYPFQLQLRQP